MLLVTCCILSVAQYLLIIQAAPFGEELSKSNRSFLQSAKMAGLPLPSPTRSEVSESALSEDTIKISGRKKKQVLCGNTLTMIPKRIEAFVI